MSVSETPITQPKTKEELFKYPIFKTIKELLQDIQNLELKEELKK